MGDVNKLLNRFRIIERMLDEISYLYVMLDRKLKEHIVHVLERDVIISKTLIADIAYLMNLTHTLPEILSKLMSRLYVSSKVSLKLSREALVTNIVHNLLHHMFSKQLIPINMSEIIYDLPEYILLKNFLLELLKRLRLIIKEFQVKKLLKVQPWLRPIYDGLRNLYLLISNILRSPIFSKISSKRITRALLSEIEFRARHGLCSMLYLEIIDMFKRLQKLTSLSLQISKFSQVNLKDVIAYYMNPSRLYEIYVLLLILYAISRNAKYVDMYETDKATYFMFVTSSKTILIAYNQRDELVEKRNLVGILDLNGFELDLEDTERYLGLPDIVIRISSEGTKKYIIIECKFRFSISSIIESRYKVLGYLLEFDVPEAVLVFPRLKINTHLGDSEEVSQHELIIEAIKQGVVLEYNEKIYRRLFLVCIDPKEDPVVNINLIEQVLKRLHILEDDKYI